jgi:hypothetical protein
MFSIIKALRHNFRNGRMCASEKFIAEIKHQLM